MSTMIWIALAAAVLAVLIFVLYCFDAPWTGFKEFRYTKSQGEEFERGKTLWDWLQLLAIPAVLVGAAFLLNKFEDDRDQHRVERRAALDREITHDGQRERVLQAYLDQMSELMLASKLREATEDSAVRNVGRTRTITTVRQLDGERRGILVRFLQESGLIRARDPVVNLKGADLRGAHLHRASLVGASLAEADLSGVDLGLADLTRADLSHADLSGACLGKTRLRHADLDHTSFINAWMLGAKLNPSRGTGTSFDGADLREASGAATELHNPTFRGAWWDNLTDIEGAALDPSWKDPEDVHPTADLCLRRRRSYPRSLG